ncbi:MAG: hypothetical protein ACRDSP_02860 [Pseudonocardiaceae bacterium]
MGSYSSGLSRLRGRSVGEVIARVVVAAGLAYDSYTHFDLAGSYAANVAAISQGTLFRIEAVLAGLAALLVLVTRRRTAAIFALLVASSALGAVLLYRYVNIDAGILGLLPDMYEPTWYPEKVLSAVAEAAATIAAVYFTVAVHRQIRKVKTGHPAESVS